MYTYTAGATGLDAAMPLWVQAGGREAWIARLRDPAIRARVAAEMRRPGQGWENLFHGAGPEGMMFSDFRNPALRRYAGRTLAEVARERGTSPEETAMDLVVEDGSRVGTMYFLMSEDNVRREVRLPWVSFGSDAASIAPEGVFLNEHPASPHLRQFRPPARPLCARRGAGAAGRGDQAADLAARGQSRHRPARRAAARLLCRSRHLRSAHDRRPGDLSRQPHAYAVGMRHVFVNGAQVLRDGEPTGATPGRVVRGPGWQRCH